ncbi:MAG: hypothetical protein NZ585_03845 [Chloracidobacterium sp.]|nr:hypothetical protein [Chloracidobacterium sp.]MDW8217511.1 hypothetical protein [Acidobacteriota bacterium]
MRWNIGIGLGLWLAVTASLLFGQSSRPVRLRFTPGAFSTTVSGTLTGYAYRDYVVRARAGQVLSFALSRSTPQPVGVVLPAGGGDPLPGGEDRTGHVTLPADGDYIVRVLLMRNDARRTKRAIRFSLTVEILP